MTEEKLLSLTIEQIDLLFKKCRYEKKIDNLEELMLMFFQKIKISKGTKEYVLQGFKDIKEYINDLTNYVEDN